MPAEESQAVQKNKFLIFLNTSLLSGTILFLWVLPFHRVIKQVLPAPAGTYWKEILLVILMGLWLLRSAILRKFPLHVTPLDYAVVFYLGLILLRWGLDRSGAVGAWGLYVSVMYLPLFWLIQTVLQCYPAWLKHLLTLLVLAGSLVACGGIIEFIADVSLFPFAENVQRYGFPDVYVYGTHLRRVYFVLESPTTLANTLALLLPLNLSLIGLYQRRWMRWVLGVTAVLLALCILITFSRGIWVALLLAMSFMTWQGGARRLNRRFLWIGLGLVIAAGAVGILSGTLRHNSEAVPYQGVVELSSASYRDLPVMAARQFLLESRPVYGESVQQVWSIFDPIENRADIRSVLYQHPVQPGKSEIIYRVSIPASGALQFAAALSPQVWSPEKGDGVTFQIYVTAPEAPFTGRFVFSRYINPKLSPNDRRWHNFVIDLSAWAGQTVNLSLITEAGPAGEISYDWAGWADPQIVSIQPDYFQVQHANPDNPVLQQLRSILDWSSDETNRDRLRAWRTALQAWQQTPLWGTGLGTTGVAALRTTPEQAFVTESQVLKALTELGLPGILVLAYLYVQIGLAGYRAVRKKSVGEERMILLGVMTALLVVFIESWIYQNLEVKQVNACFWTLVGILAFLTAGKENVV